jgi:simple sugar transport system permease protein
MNIWIDFLLNALAFGVIFIYGSTGEILTEKAGHLNLGVPGVMCMGAAGGCLMLNAIGGGSLPGFMVVLLGTLCAILMGALMGLIYSFLTVSLRANQNVTGLAMTTFGVGMMKVIFSKVDYKVYLLKTKSFFRWPFADRLDSLQKMGALFFLGIIIALLAHFVLYRTKVGLHLRAVGENPATADAVGINVTRYKYLATCIGCAISGMGGLYTIMDYTASREAYINLEAYGWLSVALVIFALWRPALTILGSFLFGILCTIPSYITNFGVSMTMTSIPLMNMLPYVVTIIVLIITSVRNKREDQPPASLGLSYFREER